MGVAVFLKLYLQIRQLARFGLRFVVCWPLAYIESTNKRVQLNSQIQIQRRKAVDFLYMLAVTN